MQGHKRVVNLNIIVDVIVFVTQIFFAITKKVVPTSGLLPESCAKIRVSVLLEQFIPVWVFNEVVRI